MKKIARVEIRFELSDKLYHTVIYTETLDKHDLLDEILSSIYDNSLVKKHAEYKTDNFEVF